MVAHGHLEIDDVDAGLQVNKLWACRYDEQKHRLTSINVVHPSNPYYHPSDCLEEKILPARKYGEHLHPFVMRV